MITHETIIPNFKINTSKSICLLEAIDIRDNDSCNSSGGDESIEYNAYSLCNCTFTNRNTFKYPEQIPFIIQLDDNNKWDLNLSTNQPKFFWT
jgi:hypothetical protein